MGARRAGKQPTPEALQRERQFLRLLLYVSPAGCARVRVDVEPESCPKGPNVPKHVRSLEGSLGIATMVSGTYLPFWYLDPCGVLLGALGRIIVVWVQIPDTCISAGCFSTGTD